MTEYEPLLPVFFLIEHRPVAEQRFLAEKICLRVIIFSFSNTPLAIASLKMTVMGKKNNLLARVKEKVVLPGALAMVSRIRVRRITYGFSSLSAPLWWM